MTAGDGFTWSPHRWHGEVFAQLERRLATDGGLVLLTGRLGSGAEQLIDQLYATQAATPRPGRHSDLRHVSIARLVRALTDAADDRSGMRQTLWTHRLDEALDEIGVDTRRGLRARLQQGGLTIVGILDATALLRDAGEPLFFGAEPVRVDVAPRAPEGDAQHDLLVACLGWRVGMAAATSWAETAEHAPTGNVVPSQFGAATVGHVADSLEVTLERFAPHFDLEAVRLGSTGRAIVDALGELARPPSSSTLAWAINRSPQQVSNALGDLVDAGVVSDAPPEVCVGWQVTNWRLTDPLWAARRGRPLLTEWVAQTALVRLLHDRTNTRPSVWPGHLDALRAHIAPMIATEPPTPDSARGGGRHPAFLPPAGRRFPDGITSRSRPDQPLPPPVKFSKAPARVLLGGRRVVAPWVPWLLTSALPDEPAAARQLALIITALQARVIPEAQAADACTAARTIAETVHERQLCDLVFRTVMGMSPRSSAPEATACALEVGGHELATLVDVWSSGEFHERPH